jgi:hypothetical protein
MRAQLWLGGLGQLGALALAPAHLQASGAAVAARGALRAGAGAGAHDYQARMVLSLVEGRFELGKDGAAGCSLGLGAKSLTVSGYISSGSPASCSAKAVFDNRLTCSCTFRLRYDGSNTFVDKSCSDEECFNVQGVPTDTDANCTPDGPHWPCQGSGCYWDCGTLGITLTAAYTPAAQEKSNLAAGWKGYAGSASLELTTEITSTDSTTQESSSTSSYSLGAEVSYGGATLSASASSEVSRAYTHTVETSETNTEAVAYEACPGGAADKRWREQYTVIGANGRVLQNVMTKNAVCRPIASGQPLCPFEACASEDCSCCVDQKVGDTCRPGAPSTYHK